MSASFDVMTRQMNRMQDTYDRQRDNAAKLGAMRRELSDIQREMGLDPQRCRRGHITGRFAMGQADLTLALAEKREELAIFRARREDAGELVQA